MYLKPLSETVLVEGSYYFVKISKFNESGYVIAQAVLDKDKVHLMLQEETSRTTLAFTRITGIKKL